MEATEACSGFSTASTSAFSWSPVIWPMVQFGTIRSYVFNFAPSSRASSVSDSVTSKPAARRSAADQF